MQTTAELTCRALGVKPVGQKWGGDQPLVCAMEGRKIEKGDWVAPFKPGANFMSDAFLAARSPVISGWVRPLIGRDLMAKIQRAVITTDGVFPVHKRIHRAYFLLNPPKPPFAWVISDAKMQHLLWMAPLNWSQEQYRIRFGSRLLVIRHERVMATVERYRDAEQLPWASNDWSLREIKHGQFRTSVPEETRKELSTLTTGESWAAGVILMSLRAKKEEDHPQKPDPIQLEE